MMKSPVVTSTVYSISSRYFAKSWWGDLTNAVIAIDLGSHMVDVSPLSTLGALCLAALPEKVNRSQLFRQLLVWGFSMTIVAGILAFLFLDLL
jgi:uncharacterized membrane protein YagU involved in acid resistance